MADKPEHIVVVGGVRHAGRPDGSTCRRCQHCGGQSWYTKASQANALAMAGRMGASIKWICLACVPRVHVADDFEVGAYSPEQIAELHAAGIDESAEQLQAKVQEMGHALLRDALRRKGPGK